MKKEREGRLGTLYAAPGATVQLQGLEELTVLVLRPPLPPLRDRVRLPRLVRQAWEKRVRTRGSPRNLRPRPAIRRRCTLGRTCSSPDKSMSRWSSRRSTAVSPVAIGICCGKQRKHRSTTTIQKAITPFKAIGGFGSSEFQPPNDLSPSRARKTIQATRERRCVTSKQGISSARVTGDQTFRNQSDPSHREVATLHNTTPQASTCARRRRRRRRRRRTFHVGADLHWGGVWRRQEERRDGRKRAWTSLPHRTGFFHFPRFFSHLPFSWLRFSRLFFFSLSRWI
jgi:hypothetical protein